MRRPLRLLPLAMVLVAAAAFPAAASAVTPGDYTQPGFNPANAPSGTHLATKSATPTCTVGANLNISCNSYTLGGVGHTNATLNLTAAYNETVQCTNGGNNTVVAQQQTASAGPITVTPSAKNGNMTVPSIGVTAPVLGSTSKGSPCPNRNWTATVIDVTLHTFDYTLTFDGFTNPAVEITATDP